MKDGEKKMAKWLARVGMGLIGVLALTAGGFSWKLIITIPIGVVAYYCLAVSIGGGAVMLAKSGELDIKD